MSQVEETQNPEPEATEPETDSEETKEPEKPKQPANELKVIINIKDDSILVGVQSPDCDPVFKSLKGTLAFALKQVPIVLKEAREKWAAAPLNPKAELPEPPAPVAPARTPTASKPAKKSAQPSFF